MDTLLEQSQGFGPIFTAAPVGLEQQGLKSGQRRLSHLSAASGSVLAAFHGGEVARWYPDEDEFALIDFGRDRIGDVSRLLLDPTGFHALLTNSSGETWYLNFQSNQAKPLPKLKGHVLESAAWDPEATTTSTRDILLGTRAAQILHVVIEGKERTVKSVFEFDRPAPVVGVHCERIFSSTDGLERLVFFAVCGCRLYAFIGTSLESLFQRQGEACRAVFEVPRESPYGDLQVDDACVGPPGTKVLFWMTGVGVLAAKIQPTIDEDASVGSVLEAPPGLIAFPATTKALPRSDAGSLVTSLLPAPTPPPRSMALTKYHILFAFEDRWVAVSRITHEVVQQQDWAMSTYGPLRSLARDQHGERLWICSERHAFELLTEKEDRNVWALLLRFQQFDDALAACKKQSQRMRVLAAHADWLFREGEGIESARKFAEATAVPFEHVALRFLGADMKAALVEYLRCRLTRADDQVTRALLYVWAVEISLARLNAASFSSNFEARGSEERQTLLSLLKESRDLDVHATIYHLLQSHGWLDELAQFAEIRRDFTTVILHHVSRREYGNAIQKLSDFKGSNAQELVCRFAPVLFGAEPKAFVSLLLRPQLSGVDPLLVLPGIYTPSTSPTHRLEAMRYLEHAARHALEFSGHADVRASSFRTGSLLHNLVDDDGTGVASQRFGWATGTAILNTLVLCSAQYLEDGPDHEGDEYSTADAVLMGAGSDAERALLRLLTAEESNPFMDPHFALRVCRQGDLVKAQVFLYGHMGMHEESVDVALQHEDVALAKQSACKPPLSQKRLRRKLWLRIVEHEAATCDVQKIIGLIRESKELTIRDVLPYLPDSMTIDAFKAEISEFLDTYEGQIVTLRQEMDDHRRALKAFKEDLKQAEERCIVVAQDQACELCGGDVLRERFYAFACGHCFHEACLRA
ncbi:vps18, partial [Symbiodinium necroappetens]